ncbi:hypothetical protein ACSCB1_35275 [Streptomyces europaeiscabiei]|uniref:hypothetical protein n=1 Tax=Streptomyces europaeiscabiei TaxID=146819 RepID=UPI00131DE3D8|nr:hypothetical protein [Streptomyces europaeiscabiei]
MPKITVDPSHWSLRLEPRNYEICQLYASGKFTTEQIARSFHLNPRQVQRIVKQGGVGRTLPEANRVMAPLKSKHRVRKTTLT